MLSDTVQSLLAQLHAVKVKPQQAYNYPSLLRSLCQSLECEAEQRQEWQLRQERQHCEFVQEMIRVAWASADVELVAADGTAVGANRSQLCRSEYFSRMLGSLCSEGLGSHICMDDLDGQCLTYLVASVYMGPDKVIPLRYSATSGFPRVEQLRQLVAAGSLYELPWVSLEAANQLLASDWGLRGFGGMCPVKTLELAGSHLCAIHSREEKGPWEKVEVAALKAIVRSPEGATAMPGFGSLDPTLLLRVLSAFHRFPDELRRFRGVDPYLSVTHGFAPATGVHEVQVQSGGKDAVIKGHCIFAVHVALSPGAVHTYDSRVCSAQVAFPDPDMASAGSHPEIYVTLDPLECQCRALLRWAGHRDICKVLLRLGNTEEGWATELSALAERYVVRAFCHLLDRRGLLQLPVPVLRRILQDDDLHTGSDEMAVLKFLGGWIRNKTWAEMAAAWDGEGDGTGRAGGGGEAEGASGGRERRCATEQRSGEGRSTTVDGQDPEGKGEGWCLWKERLDALPLLLRCARMAFIPATSWAQPKHMRLFQALRAVPEFKSLFLEAGHICSGKRPRCDVEGLARQRKRRCYTEGPSMEDPWEALFTVMTDSQPRPRSSSQS